MPAGPGFKGDFESEERAGQRRMEQRGDTGGGAGYLSGNLS